MDKSLNENKKPKKKKSFIKRIFIGLGSAFFLIVILAVLLPYFFKDDIIAMLKDNINENLNAKVEFSDLDISLFKHFPDFSLAIHDISMVNNNAGDTIFEAPEIDLTVDLKPVILSKNKLKIKHFAVLNPNLRLYVDAEGKSNFDIFKADADKSQQEESTGLKDISLKNYIIKNANILYVDKQSNVKLDINALKHEGDGDFSNGIFSLNTHTSIPEITIVQNTIPILKNAKLQAGLDFAIDIDKMFIDIVKSNLRLNDLVLESKGHLILNDDNIDMNMNINAPGNNFKEIFSIIPNAYTKEYDDITAKGFFTFKAGIKGKYVYDTEQYPDFDLSIKSKDGYIKYPDLKIPLENINSDIHIYKKGSIDNTTIDIKGLTFSINNKLNMLKLSVKNLFGNMAFNGKYKGILDLKELSAAFPLNDIKSMNGTINSDVVFALDKNLTRKKLQGDADITRLSLDYNDLPPISLGHAGIDFNDDNIAISLKDMKAGATDFNGNATLDNVLSYITDKAGIVIGLDGKSHLVNADEWLQDGDTEEKEPADKDLMKLLKKQVKFKASLDIDKLIYEDYDMRNISVNAVYNADKLDINGMSLLLSGSRFDIAGTLSNLVEWVFLDNTLQGNMNIESPYFDVDKFMATGQDNTQTSEEMPFELPENMDINLRTGISKLSYEKKKLANLHGNVNIGDRRMSFDDFSVKAFGGDIQLAGSLATVEEKDPLFDIKYKMTGIRYDEIFNSVVTYRKLAPLARYMHGVFDANFKIDGKLTEDLSPVLTSLTATGIVKTIDAYIKSYPPLQHLASKLQINTLKDLKLENTKSIIEIINGAVNVKPFDVTYDGMRFNISGVHKLDQTIDYKIKAIIPRSKIAKVPGGKSVNKGLDYVLSLANSAGAKVGDLQNVKLDIILQGPFDNPKIKIRYAGSEDDELKNSVNNKIDNTVNDAKDKVNEQLDKTQDKIKQKVNQAVDSTKNKAKKELDEQKNKVKDKAKKELEKVDSTVKKKTKKILDKFNPFKK